MKKLLALLMALVLMLTGTTVAAIAEEAPAAAAEEEAAETEAAEEEAEEEAAAEEEEDSFIYIDADTTNLIELSAAEWFDSGTSRAMLTVLLLLDLGFAGVVESDDLDFLSTSYVGKSELNLVVFFHLSDGNGVFITYQPLTGLASYHITDAVSDWVIEQTLEGTCTDGWHENSLTDIVEVLEALSEIVNS